MSRLLSEIDESLRSAVVPLAVYDSRTAAQPARRGTGYLVHPYYLATCYHTVFGSEADPFIDDPIVLAAKRIEIRAGVDVSELILIDQYTLDQTQLTAAIRSAGLPIDGEHDAWLTQLPAKIEALRANGLRDCVLLRLQNPLEGRRSLALGVGYSMGEEVWIRGFPQSSGWTGNEQMTLPDQQFAGRICSTCAIDYLGRFSFSIYFPAIAARGCPAGLSGAPVVTRDGLCIGHIKNYFTIYGTSPSDVHVHAGQLYATPSMYVHQLMPHILPTLRRQGISVLSGRHLDVLKTRSTLSLGIGCSPQNREAARKLAEVINVYVRPYPPVLEARVLEGKEATDVTLFLMDDASFNLSQFKSRLQSGLGQLQAQPSLAAFAYLSIVSKEQEAGLIHGRLFENAFDLTDEATPYSQLSTQEQSKYWLRMVSRLYRYIDSN